MLPLLNSAFKPGTAVEVVERFEDSDFRNIARAELFYFSGRAKECCEIAESYLEDEAIELRLSACILYGYSNLSLGNSAAARRGLEGIQECMKLVKREGASKEVQAVCVLAGYAFASSNREDSVSGGVLRDASGGVAVVCGLCDGASDVSERGVLECLWNV